MKTLVVVLCIVSISLGAGLLIQHREATHAVKTAEAAGNAYSNSWQEAKGKLEEVEKVAAALETKLNTRTEVLVATSNDLAKASTDLAQTSGDLAKSQADYTAAQAEMKKQQATITQLESQRADLTQKMDELTGSIASLETKIGETKQKLARSEGDRTFLLKELERMQSEKATLVAQFNNLSALRVQVAKLKEEAAISQRLTWMQSGVYNLATKKGAERLLATSPAPGKPEGRLEIELEQNGHSKILSTPTNQPEGP
jgi:chromosome segregation ATPase